MNTQQPAVQNPSTGASGAPQDGHGVIVCVMADDPRDPVSRDQEISVSICLRSTFPVALRGSGSVVTCQRDGTLK